MSYASTNIIIFKNWRNIFSAIKCKFFRSHYDGLKGEIWRIKNGLLVLDWRQINKVVSKVFFNRNGRKVVAMCAKLK